MNRSHCLILLLLVGCGQGVAPPTVETPPTPSALTLPVSPVTNDADKLAAILKPMEWYVNDLREDEKPRIVMAPIVRSRFEKKTEADFAKLSKVLAETGTPVIVDVGGWQGTPATSEWMKHITENRSVIGLRLTDKANAKKVIAEAAKMPWLEFLELGGAGLDDADLKALAPLQKLKSFQLSGTTPGVTRASYATISGLKELRRFDLGWDVYPGSPTWAIDADYAALAGLTNLESLTLKIVASQSTDAGVAKLKALTKLRTLELDVGYDHLAGPPTIELFDAIAGMSELENLKLHLLAPSLGYSKLAALKKLKKLSYITKGFLAGEPLGNFTKHLGALTSLEELERTDRVEWTDETLADIKGLTNLRTLELGASLVTDDGLIALAGMKELTRLWCRATPITGSGLKHLAGLTKLRFLSLSMGKASDAGMASIPAFPELATLELRQTAITDATLAHLAKLPKLENLDVDETGVTDAGIPQLKKLVSLKLLDIAKTKITKAGVAELKANSKLRVTSDNSP